MENPNYYSIIPAFIRYNKRLSDSAKLMYGEITSLTNKNGYCFASNKYFSELYNLSKRQIIRMINLLEKYGYIKTIYIYGINTKNIKERRIYLLSNIENVDKPVDNSVDNLGGSDKNVTRGGDKNVTHNNKDSIDDDKIQNIYIIKEKPTKKQVLEFWVNHTEHYSNIMSMIERYTSNDWKDEKGEDIINWKSLIKKIELQGKQIFDKRIAYKSQEEIDAEKYCLNLYLKIIKKELENL